MKENTVEIEDQFDGERRVHVLKHLGPLVAIDEINASSFDPVEFRQKYFLNNRPLVVRDGLKVMDFGSAYNNWSLDYLEEKCGSNRVYVRRNTINENYRTGKAYLVQEIEFKSYVNDLKLENTMSKNSYLAVQNLKKAFPQINDELNLPQSVVEKLHAGPFLWIARRGHYEYTHMDPDDNLLTVLRGRKLVRLYGCDVHAMNPNELGSKGRTIQSQIDCDDFSKLEDESIKKKFENTTCHYCLLKEGDFLYFPAFWWHQVKSPEQVVSVNVFFGDSGDNNFVRKVMQSSQREALLYWLYNIIKQNMDYPSFNRILLNLRDSLRCFLYKQWHETPDKDQLDILYESIVDKFNLRERIEQLKETTTSETSNSKHPPRLSIRGLLQRPMMKKSSNNSNVDESFIDEE